MFTTLIFKIWDVGKNFAGTSFGRHKARQDGTHASPSHSCGISPSSELSSAFCGRISPSSAASPDTHTNGASKVDKKMHARNAPHAPPWSRPFNISVIAARNFLRTSGSSTRPETSNMRRAHAMRHLKERRRPSLPRFVIASKGKRPTQASARVQATVRGCSPQAGELLMDAYVYGRNEQASYNSAEDVRGGSPAKPTRPECIMQCARAHTWASRGPSPFRRICSAAFFFNSHSN